MITIEEITPEIAEKYLTVNTHNRSVKQRIVDRYAEMITAGEWDLNGESIKFDVNGTLLDGQHRLWAVLESKLPIKTYVVRGLHPDAMETIDTGAVRKAADLLQITGHTNTNVLAAAAKLIHAYDHKEWGLRETRLDSYISHRLVAEVIDTHPSLCDSVAKMVGHGEKLRPFLSPSVAATLHYILKRVNAEKCDEFFNFLIEGSNLTEEHPILSLRNTLYRLNGNDRHQRLFRVAVAIKAWNLFIKGKTCKTLVWREFEEFPQIEPPANKMKRKIA